VQRRAQLCERAGRAHEEQRVVINGELKRAVRRLELPLRRLERPVRRLTWTVR
jgi:hypothetical protein